MSNKNQSKEKAQEKMLDELETLFGFVSPGKLRDSLMEIYLDYCLSMQDLPVNFRKNTEHFYFLFEFLRVCQKERKKLNK